MLVVSVVCSTSRRSPMGEHISTRAHCQSSAVAIVPFLAHTHALPRFTCLPVAYSAASMLCILCHVTISIYLRIYIIYIYILPAMTQPLDRFPLTPSAATGLPAKLPIRPLLNVTPPPLAQPPRVTSPRCAFLRRFTSF